MKGVETMATRKPTKPVRRRPESTSELRQALTKRTKAELVEILLELVQADRGVLRQLMVRFDVVPAAGNLVAATHQAIVDATSFDPRDINRNFDYDCEAYAEVKRNLNRLLADGQVRPAMQLALELMERGSRQVEMSDEGLMARDVESCLNVVLQTLPNCDLPAHEVLDWCSAMLANDRVDFIAREPLQSLQARFQAAASR